MVSLSPPTSEGKSATPGWTSLQFRWLIIGYGLLWGLMTVFFFKRVNEVFDPSLDSSNYASYAYFTAHAFQYGREVISMAGPFGYIMYGFTYSGELFWSQFSGQLLLAGSLSVLTVFFFHQLSGNHWRWVWLLSHLTFTPYIEDLPIEWCILLGGVALTMPLPICGAILTTMLLGWFSLFKGTHLILAPATIGVTLLSLLSQSQFKRAVCITFTYLGSVVLFWILAGQPLTNLPSFVTGIFQLAGGYNSAMSLPAAPQALVGGIITCTLFLGLLGWAAWASRHNRVMLCGLLLFTGYLFTEWKHGFVRADGHVSIFFHFSAVAIPLVYLLVVKPRLGPGTAISKPVRLWGIVIMITGTTAAIYSGNLTLPSATEMAHRLWYWPVQNLRYLVSVQSQLTSFEAQLAEQQKTHDLPLIRKIIGKRSVDFFGHEQGVILLNRFNYQPRPMAGGSFNVYNPYLIGLNGAHLKNQEKRPDFFLLKMQTIDDRLMGPEDSQTLLAILHHYRPRLVENGYLLLENSDPSPQPTPQFIGTRAFRFGEEFSIPTVKPDEMLLFRLTIQPSNLGKLLTAVYHPPQVSIQLFGENLKPDRRRLIPEAASVPFLVSPVLENTYSFLELYTKRTPKPFERIRITTTDRAGYSPNLSIDYYTLPRPKGLPTVEIDDLLSVAHHDMLLLSPDQEPITINHAGNNIHALLVHAPGEARWPLTGHERTVEFGYGFVRGAYEGGQTDGVEFIVELLSPAGEPKVIFQRFLNPLKNADDQQRQTATIQLPPFVSGSRLRLRADPGPNNNTAWDWAYFSQLELR